MARHIREEIMIDFILGNLDSTQMKAINHHLNLCDQCRVEWRSWKSILTEKVDILPSEQLEERISKELTTYQDKDKRNSELKVKKWAIGLVSLVVVCLLVLVPKGTESLEHSYQVMHNGEITPHNIQQKTATIQLDIIPVRQYSHLQGQLWINPHTNQMLIEVKGLLPLANEDYQMWLFDRSDAWVGELLQIEDGKASIFYEGQGVDQLKLMKVSIEPKGGSQLPTGPETLYVDFNAQ